MTGRGFHKSVVQKQVLTWTIENEKRNKKVQNYPSMEINFSLVMAQ